MTNAQAFDQAFAPAMDIEPRGEWMAIVEIDGVRLCVSKHYCAHCAYHGPSPNGADGEAWCIHKQAAFGNGDGEALCRHKEALFEAERGDAQDQYETYRDALDVGIQ